MVVMTIYDCPHMGGPEEIERQIASYAPHEREARSLGLPLMGTGRVFLVPEESIKEESFQIPTHFFKLWGIDLV